MKWHGSSIIHLCGNLLYLSPVFASGKSLAVIGTPVIVCASTVESISINLPLSLRTSGYREEEIVQNLIKARPLPLWKAAKVRSGRQFEQGTSSCSVIQQESQYLVGWSFPAEKPGRRFVGKPNSTHVIFGLDEMASMSAAILAHLTDPASRYPELI